MVDHVILCASVSLSESSVPGGKDEKAGSRGGGTLSDMAT